MMTPCSNLGKSSNFVGALKVISFPRLQTRRIRLNLFTIPFAQLCANRNTRRIDPRLLKLVTSFKFTKIIRSIIMFFFQCELLKQTNGDIEKTAQ